MSEEHNSFRFGELSRHAPFSAQNSSVVRLCQGTPKKVSSLARLEPSQDAACAVNNTPSSVTVKFSLIGLMFARGSLLAGAGFYNQQSSAQTKQSWQTGNRARCRCL